MFKKFYEVIARLAKCIFLVYLYLPATHGARTIWEGWLQFKFAEGRAVAERIEKTASEGVRFSLILHNCRIRFSALITQYLGLGKYNLGK